MHEGHAPGRHRAHTHAHGYWETDEGIARLTDPDRLAWQDPEALLPLFGGDERLVVDWGCGAGFFTLALARRIPARWVAVDVSERLVSVVRERAREAGLDRLAAVALGSPDLAPLVGTADAVLLANVLHEVHSPESTLSACARLLRPGGLLVVVDWKHAETGLGPPLEERLPEPRIRELVAAEFAGATVVPTAYPHHVVLAARRRG